jgi:SAM-dependent methyltransferase
VNAHDAQRAASRVERYRAFDRLNRPYLEWQLEGLRPHLGRRVLEIGCGVGSILALLAPRERLFGLDVEADVLAAARARFAADPSVGFAHVDAACFSPDDIARLRAERFDSIVSLNVLEHIVDDAAVLRACAEILPSGGTLALLVPAHPVLYGAYDALDGHVRRYTRRGLSALVRAAGFELLRCRHFNAVGALGWFVQYRLLRRQLHGEGSFGLMNRLIPWLRPLERAVPPPFGLSLVALGRRA